MQLYLAIVGSKFFTIQFYSVSIPKLIIHNAERILFWRHYINSYTTTGSVKVSKCLILTAVKIWSTGAYFYDILYILTFFPG